MKPTAPVDQDQRTERMSRSEGRGCGSISKSLGLYCKQEPRQLRTNKVDIRGRSSSVSGLIQVYDRGVFRARLLRYVGYRLVFAPNGDK